MKKYIAVILLSILLAGCATESMKSTPYYTGHDVKYTGNAEDRVNLWPLAYWRAPVGSVLWPMLSFSDDHFAFRPLYSQWKRGGEWNEFNFLWPICQFDTRRDDYRIFPIFWGDDYFHIFPVLWNFDDYHTLFPIVWYDEDESFNLFPLMFWNWKHDSFTLFPIYWHRPKSECLFPLFYHDEDSTLVTPFVGWNKHGDSWAFPLYASVGDDFLSIPWCSGKDFWAVPPLLSWGGKDGDVTSQRFLGGLAGHSSTEKGYSSSWLFPLYYGNNDGLFVTPLYGRNRSTQWCFPVFYNDEESFCSWFWGHSRGKDGSIESWVIPPLLTSGGRDENGSSLNVLLALYGRRWGAPDGSSSSWLFPLYYHNSDGLLVTPLYGQSGDSHWLFPLYYHNSDGLLVTPLYGQKGDSHWLFPLFYNDEDDFASPLLCHFNSGKHSSSWFIPPLLTAWREEGFVSPLWMRDRDENFIPWLLSGYADQGREGTCLLGLGGWSYGTSWAFPLYYRNGQNGDIRTLLAGRITDRKNTYHWWLTPLLGTKSGNVSGGWFFPLVDVTRDREVAELEKLMYADTLDASVTGSYRDHVRYVGKGVYETNRVFSVRTRSASNETSFLFGLGGCERNLRLENNDENRLGWGDSVQKMAGDKRRRTKESGKTVSFTDSADIGNIFLFKRKSERAVSFDYDTKEKIFEGRVSSTGVLCHLLWHAKREVIEGGHDYSESSILWRLWHREALDGDTTTDVFPFITIDNKKNGFTKTSFLWRFFRYEKDPEKGTKIDFLFLPIWR